jgi:hypothetical protein
LPAASVGANSVTLPSDGLAELGATKALPSLGFRGLLGAGAGTFRATGDLLSLLPGVALP